jgi:hypothetical protein
MFKRKKRKQSLTMADMSSRTRGFILDSQIQNAHEISIMLGCSNISDELAEREEEESDKRVERLSYLIPLIYAYSKTLAEGTTTFQKENAPEELKDISSEIWIQSKKMMEEFAFSVLVGAVSQMIDMELLTIPKDKR